MSENDMAGYQCRRGHTHASLYGARVCGQPESISELRAMALNLDHEAEDRVSPQETAIALYRVGAALCERLDALVERLPERGARRSLTGDWRRAALQARRDLKDIEDAFAAGDPPIGPGHRWAEWCSPANTIRWIDRLERGEGDRS